VVKKTWIFSKKVKKGEKQENNLTKIKTFVSFSNNLWLIIEQNQQKIGDFCVNDCEILRLDILPE
jgi:hypothetical protein